MEVSGGKIKTNGKASETHMCGSVSYCLQPLWEASWHVHAEVRISREEDGLFPDHILSSLGFSDIVESVRGLYEGSLRSWEFWFPKDSKLINQPNLDISFTSTH